MCVCEYYRICLLVSFPARLHRKGPYATGVARGRSHGLTNWVNVLSAVGTQASLNILSMYGMVSFGRCLWTLISTSPGQSCRQRVVHLMRIPYWSLRTKRALYLRIFTGEPSRKLYKLG